MDERVLQSILDKEEPESATLEYKETLSLEKDSEKLEFLADVSSFANKYGGVIIYGVRDKKDENGLNTGMPGDIRGLRDWNFDQVIQKIENILDSGIQPRLPHRQILRFERDGQLLLAISISRSIFAPHCISHSRLGKFYSRNSNGKYQMDVHELRTAFLQASEWEKAAREFRKERFRTLKAEFPVDKADPLALLVTHFIPLGLGREELDMYQIITESDKVFFNLFAMRDRRPNLDGYLWTGSRRGIQLFRNGGIESFIEVPCAQKAFSSVKFCAIDGKTIVTYLKSLLEKSLVYWKGVEIMPPLAMLFTLRIPGNCIVAFTDNNRIIGFEYEEEFRSHLLGRCEIFFDHLILDDIDSSAKDAIDPIISKLWQASGWPSQPTQF